MGKETTKMNKDALAGHLSVGAAYVIFGLNPDMRSVIFGLDPDMRIVIFGLDPNINYISTLEEVLQAGQS